MKEYQVAPSSDKLPISVVGGRDAVYLVIHIPIQGFRYSQSIDFKFFNALKLRLHLDLRPNEPFHPVQDSGKSCWHLPPAHWHGSLNAVWIVKFYTKPGPYEPNTSVLCYEVSTDGDTFPAGALEYIVHHGNPLVSSFFDIDAVAYNYVGYDLVHRRAITDAEKMATIAVFKGPTSMLEAQSYFSKQLELDAPSKALKDIETREQIVGYKQEAVNSKEKAQEETEKKQKEMERILEEKRISLREKEAALEAREQSLHAREVALEQKEKTEPQAQTPPVQPARSDIRPSDYDWLKISATKAWPGVIKEVFGRDSWTEWMEEYRDFMKNWVEERGDNLPSTAYDYMIYAHGVAWPHILMQHSSDEDFVRAREKHTAFMRILI